MGRVHRLAQVIERALLERLDRVGYLALARNHDGGQADSQLVDIAQQLEPALARHPQVRQQDMRVEARDKLQRPHPVFGDFPVETPRRQRLAPLVVRVHVIFGDQYSYLSAHKISPNMRDEDATGRLQQMCTMHDFDQMPGPSRGSKINTISSISCSKKI